MTTFDDPVAAQRTRDILTRLMIKVLDQERPPYEYGTTTQIDPDLNSCKVLLNGDEEAVTVKFGAMRPAFVGQVVRVSGNRGDRFISDVIGGAILADVPTDALVAPVLDLQPSLSGVWAYWSEVVGAAKYELHIADNAAFTVNLRSFVTTATQFTLSSLTPGATYYARVRALTSDNQTGPWSAMDSAAAGLVTYQPSDGSAPSASPQPVVTAGIGFLLAEWLPQANADPVTYEVHVSITSGFTPSGTTKVGETTGNFYFIRALPNSGGPVVYGTTYFVRLIAKDKDGSAPVGAQGSGSPAQVNTADVGRIATSEIGDGAAPASSPAVSITNGIGYLYAKWDHVANADALTYEVHVSTVNGFTPGASTLVGTTPSNFFFIRKQGSGGTPANGDLAYGTTYYVRLIAKDIDGQAAAGAQGSGTPMQAQGTDIGPNQISTGHIAAGSITAASAILADLSVATAKIQDAAITNLKVADLAVSTAKIQDLAVGEAKIADLAVSTAKIQDLAVNNAKIADATIQSAKIASLAADKITSGTIAAQIITLGASGIIKSSNYVTGSAGWQIDGAGNAEFNNVVIRGDFIAGPSTAGQVLIVKDNVGAGLTGIEMGKDGGFARMWQVTGTMWQLEMQPSVPGLVPTLQISGTEFNFASVPVIAQAGLTSNSDLQVNTGGAAKLVVSGSVVEIGAYLDFHSGGDALSGDYTVRQYSAGDGWHVWDTSGWGLVLHDGWLRTDGDRGLYSTNRSTGVYFPAFANQADVMSYNGGIFAGHRNNGAAYNQCGLRSESDGADSVGVAMHDPGQLANILKIYGPNGNSLECRDSLDANAVPIKASSYPGPSSIKIKQDVRGISAKDRIRSAKAKGKPVRATLFKRANAKTVCPLCGGKGEVTAEQLVEQPNYLTRRQIAKANTPEALAFKGLLRATTGASQINTPPEALQPGVCPNCNGEDIRNPWVIKNEDTDFLGVIAEEIEEVFPEVCWYDENGLYGIQFDALAAVAYGLASEADDEIIEHRGSIAAALAKAEAAEARAVAAEAKIAENEKRLAALERGRPT